MIPVLIDRADTFSGIPGISMTNEPFFPAIVPSSVFGATAPSNRINIGAIGVGRISRIHDMFEIFKNDDARIIAVCDLDTRRVKQGVELVDKLGLDHLRARDRKLVEIGLELDRIMGRHHGLGQLARGGVERKRGLGVGARSHEQRRKRRDDDPRRSHGTLHVCAQA